MRLFVAGERTLETLVLEGLAWRSGNVVGPFWLAFLSSFHLDLNARFLKETAHCNCEISYIFLQDPPFTEAAGECHTKAHMRNLCIK